MTFSFKENNATWSNTEVSGNTKELENNPHQLPNNDMGFLKHPESNWKASSGVLKKRCLQLCVAEFNVLKETSERARRHSHGRARAKYEWGEDIARLYSGKKRHWMWNTCLWMDRRHVVCQEVHALSLLNIYTYIYSFPWVCVTRRTERKWPGVSNDHYST